VTTYAADESGACVCADCAVGAYFALSGWQCEADACRCSCRDLDRARELDDRDPDKLAVVAAELAAERIGSLRDLTAERFRGGR
jgi:hypothetical protein